MNKTRKPKFDPAAFCLEYETGDMNAEQIVAGFQHLIDSGLISGLQGSYQRTAETLIAAGAIKRKKKHSIVVSIHAPQASPLV